MTIRKTLLVAFIAVGLLPAMLLAGLAFVQARDAVQAEIERNLTIQAVGVAADVDKMMFERLQNAVTWSRLDIMQDMQVHDVDKRLSNFLADLHSGYKDVYLQLSCIDNGGKIISSSNAIQVGLHAENKATWLETFLSGTKVQLESPSGESGGALVMRVPVAAAFSGGTLGQLQLKLDWSEIYAVLDQATNGGGRMLAILDQEGRLIAATRDLRERGLLLDNALADWRKMATGKMVSVRSGAPVIDSSVIVGGFVIDVALRGIAHEVASLVVILRLFRFVKIVDEFSAAAEEQMAGYESRIDDLEADNKKLMVELEVIKGKRDEEYQHRSHGQSGS